MDTKFYSAGGRSGGLSWNHGDYDEAVATGMEVNPDVLARGRVQGYETLFWLEVADEHKRREQIEKITRIKLAPALCMPRQAPNGCRSW